MAILSPDEFWNSLLQQAGTDTTAARNAGVSMTNGGPSNGGIDTGLGFPVQPMQGGQDRITGMSVPIPPGTQMPTGGFPSIPNTNISPPGGAPPTGGVSGYGGTAPPTPTPAGGAPAPGGAVTMQQFNDAWLQSPYPGTVDGLKQFFAAHPEYAAAGITLGGSKGDKVYGPGGAYWGDAVIAAGEGGKGKSGLSGDTGGGGGGGSTLGSLGYAFGSSMAPWNTPFQPRDPTQIANDPAYKFQLEQGLKGIQGSAAARGTLLSGGTLKALDTFGQGLASTYNDKYYGRDMGEYLLNRENFQLNQDRPFAKNLSLAQLGRPQ